MSAILASRTETPVATRTPSAVAKDRRSGLGLALGAAVQGRGTRGASTMLPLQKAAGNRAVVGLVQAIQERSSTASSARVHEAAQLGIGGASGKLPHLERIQRSFGRHDVTGVVAHVDAQARAGAQAMGAVAFTMGNHVAFAGNADLHTAAHEAAHVVQQRAGVQLAGGVGQAGDPYERHADAVAGLVVQGMSAEAALDRYAGNMTGSHVQRSAGSGSSGGSPVQAMWPFDGPSIFSREYWQGGEAPQQEQEEPQQAVRKPTGAELRRQEAAEQRHLARERRRQDQQRSRTLAGELRERLRAVEAQLINAANGLPAPVRSAWNVDEPSAVEDVRRAIDELPGAGRGQFRYDRDASEAEEQTAALERFADDYTDYCDQLRDKLALPCRFFTSSAANLDPDLTERIDDAYRSIAEINGVEFFENVIHTFQRLMKEAQRATAVDSNTLLHERKTAQGDARVRVEEYFKLGRLQIGPHRSFYASGFDAPPGSFGGEWALVANDPSLADVAKQWVYHTHCEGSGDQSTHDYGGFKIKRGVGASHIKRIEDRMVAGVSITVDCPSEFNRVEQRDQDRFQAWLDTPAGRDAIKNQNPKKRGRPDQHLWQNAPYLR